MCLYRFNKLHYLRSKIIDTDSIHRYFLPLLSETSPVNAIVPYFNRSIKPLNI